MEQKIEIKLSKEKENVTIVKEKVLEILIE